MSDGMSPVNRVVTDDHDADTLPPMAAMDAAVAPDDTDTDATPTMLDHVRAQVPALSVLAVTWVSTVTSTPWIGINGSHG